MALAATPEFPYTKETANYARLCRLLVDVGSQALRDTFNAIHSPKNLPTVLGRHRVLTKLNFLWEKGVLNETQWGKLYPSPKSSVSSINFDITLLVVLLRNICGLSQTGWDSSPHPGAVSKQADIIRLREYRNAVYAHATQASVDDAAFEGYWQSISNTIVRLAGESYAAAISKLKDESMEPEKEENYRQLLQQWKEDEDIIKKKLQKIEENMRNDMNQIRSEIGNINDKLENLMEGLQEGIQHQGDIKNYLDQMKIDIENMSHRLDDFMAQQRETKQQDGFDPTKIIDNIRQLYKNRESRLAPFPWCKDLHFSLNDIYTRLKVIFKEKTRGTATERVVTMPEIFNQHEECEEPRVVLIEGKPGMGKTTYCNKVVVDWATGKHATGNCFSNFLIVLLVKCRDVESDLWEAIRDQLLPRDVDEDQRERFFDFIRHNQSNVLLVLDGLDEVSEEMLPILSEIIQGRVLPNCRVVATARHEAGVKVRKYCDTLLEVKGFTEKDVKTFIRNYFRAKQNLAEQLIRYLSGDYKLREILTNPLNTALLCLVYEDLKGVFPESKTKLYMEIVECVLRRYRSKPEKCQTPENGEDLVDLYESQLKLLGLIAWKGLLEDKLDFDEKELGKDKASDLPGFEFLSVQPGGSERRPTRRYGFSHKTFQEFFAAFYLSRQLIKKEISTNRIAADRKFRHELKEVLLFTFGMLAVRCEETAVNLLKSIATHLNQEEKKSMNVILECVSECPKEKKNVLEKLGSALGAFLQIETVAISKKTLAEPSAIFLSNFLKTNTTVTNLTLMFSSIDGAAALRVCLKDNTSLTTLKLLFDEIGDDGAAALSECLKYNISLKTFGLDHNKIGCDGAAALGECLKDNTSLTTLNLDSNRIDDNGAAALGECLKDNTSLTTLNLDSNRIDDNGAAALGECLKHNKSLKTLNLARNQIGDRGAAALGECLKSNKSLRTLCLSGNKIGDRGADALGGCLKRNKSLMMLNLYGNEIGDDGAAALGECLKHDTWLVWLDLGLNRIGDDGAAALVAAMECQPFLKIICEKIEPSQNMATLPYDAL